MLLWRQVSFKVTAKTKLVLLENAITKNLWIRDYLMVRPPRSSASSFPVSSLILPSLHFTFQKNLNTVILLYISFCLYYCLLILVELQPGEKNAEKMKGLHFHCNKQMVANSEKSCGLGLLSCERMLFRHYCWGSPSSRHLHFQS